MGIECILLHGVQADICNVATILRRAGSSCFNLSRGLELMKVHSGDDPQRPSNVCFCTACRPISAIPLDDLIGAVRTAVRQYDETNDHDWFHNGVQNHDCIRCALVKALGPAGASLLHRPNKNISCQVCDPNDPKPCPDDIASGKIPPQDETFTHYTPDDGDPCCGNIQVRYTTNIRAEVTCKECLKSNSE